LSVTLLAACAPREPVCGPSEAGTEIRYGQGVLWRVERRDAAPSYLFGTMHSKDPEITRLAKPVAAQFDGAHSLAVEVVQTPSAVRAYRDAMEIANGDLELLIGPERMTLVEEVGARYGLPEWRLRRLKPWALSVLFSVPPAEMQTRRPTLDQVLEEKAEEREMPVYGLESVEEQIDAYDGLDLDRQIALLDAALAENWRIDCWWEEVMKPAYLTGDMSTLYALIAPQVIDGDDFLWRTLIVERNVRMVERMENRLVEGNAFIAVGAAHLPGDLGILNRLTEQGYQVAPIY
jgi:uncharacterized protein YbaP (TraB family)